MKSLIIVLLFNVCQIAAYARQAFQSSDVQLLTDREGLSNNTITDIYQDSDGFIWLGTDVGISRYDGIHFHPYSRTDEERQSIVAINETSGRLLWLRITNRNTLLCFDKLRGSFLPLSVSRPDLLQDIQHAFVLSNKLYAITSHGVAELQTSHTPEGIRLEETPLAGISGNAVKLFGENNTLGILMADKHILLYDIDRRKATTLNLSLPDTRIQNLYLYNNTLWICTDKAGLICHHPTTGTSRCLSPAYPEETGISHLVAIDKTHLIAATGSSLYYLSFDDDNYTETYYTISNLTADDSYHEHILKNRVNCIHFDRMNRVLWIGTFGRGIMKVSFKGENIYRIQPNNPTNLVKGVAQDANGYLWLATERNGIYKSNEKEVTPQMSFSPWKQGTASGNYCLHKDRNGNLWFGDEKGTVHYTNPITGETLTIHPQENKDNNASPIKELYLDSYNHLWIATEEGILLYDPYNHHTLAYKPYAQENKQVTTLCEDGDGLMWMGTNNGLACARLENKQLEITFGYEQKEGLAPGKVLSLYLNSYNQLLVAYMDKIIQIDGKEKTASSIKLLQKGLPNGRIACIADDKSGNTWLGTNSGILTVNNKSNALYAYAFSESYYAVCRLNDGKLLWANSTGLMYFDPRTVKESSKGHKFFIADMDVNDEKVETGKDINGQTILDKPSYLTRHLHLKHNNNNLILYLSDLTYSASSPTIAYRLLPDEPDWHFSHNDQIRLSNMKAGEYALEIKPLYPMEGDEAITRLNIHVEKHWAATGWAIAGYAVVVILCILAIRLYNNQRELKRNFYKAKEVHLQEKLEEETEIRKEEEKSHRMRDQIRYTLAQELRTPLALVTAPLKEIINNATLPGTLLQKAKVAYRNSISLQDICNQLLTIYQQENNDTKLNVAPYSASDIADEAVRSSYELLNVSPINLHYDKNNRINTEIWIDRKKIIFVLRNIFSNAYRHISYSGSIRFDVKISNINGTNFCLFCIEDDGKLGIKESSVTFLTSGNHQTPGDPQHPELGLEIMKETVAAHQGDIRIQQEKEKGTQVTLYIPLGKQHLEGKEYINLREFGISIS